jgi:hypothetical protein
MGIFHAIGLYFNSNKLNNTVKKNGCIIYNLAFEFFIQITFQPKFHGEKTNSSRS